MKYLLVLLIAVTCFIQVFAQQHERVGGPLVLEQTEAKWREDIKFFREHFPVIHVSPFHALTREKFNAALDTLEKDLPNLRGSQVMVRFAQLIAEVKDGHCSVADDSMFAGGVYPLRFGIYPDGVLIQSGAKEYENIIGGKLAAIDGIQIGEILKRLDTVAWGDRGNEMSRKDSAALLLSMPLILNGLGIADSDKSINLTVDMDGQKLTHRVNAITNPRDFFINSTGRVYANRNASNPLPLYLKNPEDFYRFEYLAGSKAMYVQFNVTQNKQVGESIGAFTKRLFAAADENQAEKLVLDLRLNTGGNSFLNKPLVLGLIRSRFNERGKLFIIIGRRTYSAAQNLVNELEKYTAAIFVGEPTGSSPNMHGDPATLILPNSHLAFRVPTRWHQQSELGALDTRTWTEPEIYTEPTAADYINNVDLAMDAVLSFAPGGTFRDLANAAAENFVLDDFLKKYREFKAASRNRFVNTEVDVNRLGYALLNAKRFDDAVAVFKLNTTAYPRSANTFDSLGEAYMLAGNNAEAIKAYEAALKLDPNFNSSIDALRKLKGQ